MPKYEIWMPSTVTPVGHTGGPLWQPLARTDEDLALEVGDTLTIPKRYGTWTDEPFEFQVVVSEIERVLTKKGMQICYYVDVANKEVLPRVREILKRLNPGVFED